MRAKVTIDADSSPIASGIHVQCEWPRRVSATDNAWRLLTINSANAATMATLLAPRSRRASLRLLLTVEAWVGRLWD